MPSSTLKLFGIKRYIALDSLPLAGHELKAEFTRRVGAPEGELPTAKFIVEVEEGSLVEVETSSVDIVLYNAENLYNGKDRKSTNTEWEIVSINTYGNHPYVTPPMDLSAIVRNYFASDPTDPYGVGGTAAKTTLEQVIKSAKSFLTCAPVRVKPRNSP
jgi:hypothetical protein